MKLILLLSCGCLLALSSCNNTTSTNAPEPTALVATDENTKELKARLKDVAEEEKRLEKEAESNMTTMSFNVLKHEFGTVKKTPNTCVVLS